jgi:ABC-type nitrate/sulfonate/bicarbonate transport system substrate-binding protein
VRFRKGGALPLLAALAAMAVFVAACGADEESTEGAASTEGLSKVRMVGSGLDQGALIWPIYVGMDEGVFEKHGIDFEYAATVSNGTLTLQALTAGEADFAVTAADRFVDAIDKGAPVTLAGANFAAVFQFLVKNEVKGWDDVKGMTIGTSSTQFTGSDNVLKVMLEAHGIKTTDVNVLGVGSSSERFVAAQRGAVDGMNVSEPYASAIKKLGTYKVLGESWSPENPEAFYPFEAYGLTEDFEKENPETVKDFMRSLQEAQDWLLDPANKQRAMELLIKYTKVEPDVAEAVYSVYFEQSKGAYENIGIDEEKLRLLLNAMERPYSDKYNNSIAAPMLAEMAGAQSE